MDKESRGLIASMSFVWPKAFTIISAESAEIIACVSQCEACRVEALCEAWSVVKKKVLKWRLL